MAVEPTERPSDEGTCITFEVPEDDLESYKHRVCYSRDMR